MINLILFIGDNETGGILGDHPIRPDTGGGTQGSLPQNFEQWLHYLGEQGLLVEGQDPLNLDVVVDGGILLLHVPPKFLLDSGHSWRKWHVPPFWNEDGARLKLSGVRLSIENGTLRLFNPNQDKTTIAHIDGLPLNPMHLVGTVKPRGVYFTDEGKLKIDIPYSPDEDITERVLRSGHEFSPQLQLSTALFTLAQLARYPDPNMRITPPPGNPALAVPRMIEFLEDASIEITAKHDTINIPPVGPLTQGLTLWQNPERERSGYLKAVVSANNPYPHDYRIESDVDDLYDSLEEFKQKAPEQFDAVMVKLPDGREIFHTLQGSEKKLAEEIINRHAALIYKYGFKSPYGDIVCYGHTTSPVGSPLEIRILAERKNLSSFAMSVETHGDTKALEIQGLGRIELPILYDLYTTLKVEGNLEHVSFKDWVLSLQQQGRVEATGQIVVPPMEIDGSHFPGLVLDLEKGETYVTATNFHLNLDKGNLSTEGFVHAQFKADAVTLLPDLQQQDTKPQTILGPTVFSLLAGADQDDNGNGFKAEFVGATMMGDEITLPSGLTVRMGTGRMRGYFEIPKKLTNDKLVINGGLLVEALALVDIADLQISLTRGQLVVDQASLVIDPKHQSIEGSLGAATDFRIDFNHPDLNGTMQAGGEAGINFGMTPEQASGTLAGDLHLEVDTNLGLAAMHVQTSAFAGNSNPSDPSAFEAGLTLSTQTDFAVQNPLQHDEEINGHAEGGLELQTFNQNGTRVITLDGDLRGDAVVGENTNFSATGILQGTLQTRQDQTLMADAQFHGAIDGPDGTQGFIDAQFMMDGTQDDQNRRVVDAVFQTILTGTSAAASGQAALETRMRIEPAGKDDQDLRISAPEVIIASDISLDHGGHIESRITEGRAKKDFPSGIEIIADHHEEKLGSFANVTVNLALQNMEIRIPSLGMGRFYISGQLLGTMDLVNIADDGTPNYRPIAGTIGMEIINADIKQVKDGKLVDVLGRTKIELTDDGFGKLSVDARIAHFNLGIGPDFNLNLSDIANDLAIKFDAVRTLMFEDGSEVPYYDIPEIDTISAFGVFRAVEKNIGELHARYAAVVDQIQSGSPVVKFNGTVPIKPQSFTINKGDKTGQIQFSEGSIVTNGKAEFFGPVPKSAKLRSTLTLPQKLKLGWKQTLEDGSTFEFTGDLDAQAKITTDIDFVAKKLSVQPQAPLDLTGPVQVKHTSADGTVRKFKIGIEQSASFKVTGSFRGDKAHLAIDVPSIELTATVLEAFDLAGITIPQGSSLSLPFTGFQGACTLGLKGKSLAVSSSFTPFDFGPARLEVPGSPLEKFELAPLKGPITVTLQGLTHGQRYGIEANKNEVAFGTEGETNPYELLLDARVGDDVNVHLNANTESHIMARYDLATQKLQLEIRALKIDSEVDGFAKLLGKILNLDNLDAQVALGAVSLTIDAQENTAHLSIVAPTDRPEIQLPQSIDEFFKWTREQWQAWREHMNNRGHLATLSKKYAALPASPLPRGKGEIYLDLLPTEIDVDLGELQKNQDAVVTELTQTLKDQVRINREWPNVPLPNPIPDDYEPKAALLYSYGQDALFFMDPRDTEMIETVQRVFQFADPADARRMFENGRIDIEDILADKFFSENFGEAAIRGILDSLFADSPANSDFSEAGERFLLTLGDLREGLSGNMPLVKWKKTFWSDKVRETMHRSFPDHRFQEAMPADHDGTNQTTIAYLPFSPGKVYGLISAVENRHEWVPGVTRSEVKNGQLHGSYAGGVDFISDYQQESYESVRVLSETSSPDAGTKNQVQQSSRYLVVPHTKGGSIVILQQARDFNGEDAAFYKGRDENLNEAGYADSFFNTPNWSADFFASDEFDALDPKSYLKLLRMDALNNRTKRVAFPNTNPADVSRSLNNRMISNLHHRLAAPKDKRNLNTEVKVEPQTLTYYPAALNTTTTPSEFLFLQEKVEGDDADSVTAGLTLKVDDADRERVEKLLVYGLGCDETAAQKVLDDGLLSYEYLQTLPFLKERYHPDTILALARTFIETVPQHFPGMLSMGERFLIFLHDIREHGKAWEDGFIDARAFKKPRHHKWSPHNNVKPSDGTDSALMTSLPKGMDFYELLKITSHPENFKKVSDGDNGEPGDFIKTAKAPACPEPDEGYYCAQSRIDLIVTEADYIIKVPEQMTFVGKDGKIMENDLLPNGSKDVPEGYLGLAPWWWQPSPGFEENQGMWITIPKLNGGFDVVRVGFLNTMVDGDEDAAMDAFKPMSKFLHGFHRETLKAMGKNEPAAAIQFSGNLFDYDQEQQP